MPRLSHAPAPRRYLPGHFLNRELAMLSFNRRVFAMAQDAKVPLLERLRYLCIVSSNLDEFFEIRVAGLKEQIKLGSPFSSTDGQTPSQIFKLVASEAHRLVQEQYQLLNQEILPALIREGVQFFPRATWSDAQREWIREYFFREMMPVLTPIGLDPSHPFPKVLNKSLNFAVELEGKDAFGRNSGTAIVQAPRVLPRVIQLPPEISGTEYGFVFLSSILHAYVGELFSGMSVLGCYQFRVTRNSDLFVDDEEVKNLRAKLQVELPQRHFGDAVRLEIAENCSDSMAQFLLTQFNLEVEDLYRVKGLVNLARLIQIPDCVDRPDLKFQSFKQGLPKEVEKRTCLFAAIRKNDILLHHPYQSFLPVVELLHQAEKDPYVVAIKMTVYRTGTDSVLMESLLRAAKNGKEVTVVVELMARFDEEANINWATRLEEVGAHVVYGVVGYKTHAKMLMIVRREEEEGKSVLRRYVHLGTGNYHPKTARLYTDYGLMTARPEISSDVGEVFKQLTGLGRAQSLNYLWQAPFSLHSNLIAAVRNEAIQAENGRKARIIAKMNSLLEPEIIEALYDASRAGVKIDLVVRGACALRPGEKGLSENIRVFSIIGRFLEHHRVFYFFNNGAHDTYLSSADWMERNFFRRIELCFPVLDPKLKRRIMSEVLRTAVQDNQQGWEMNFEGKYLKRKAGRSRPLSSQESLLHQLASEYIDRVSGADVSE